MCTLTVSDFDALDVLDADSVLTAGDILASEKRAENLRLAKLPFVKNPGGFIDRVIASETREQKKIESNYSRVPGSTTGRVIVH